MFFKKDILKPDYNIGDTVWGYFHPLNCSPGGKRVSKPLFKRFKIANVSYKVSYNQLTDVVYDTTNKDLRSAWAFISLKSTHVHKDLTALKMKLLTDPEYSLS